MIYQHPYARPSSNYHDSQQYFSTKTPASQLHYAKPAISTWVLELVVDAMQHESNHLVSKEGGLRVRASRKKAPDISLDQVMDEYEYELTAHLTQCDTSNGTPSSVHHMLEDISDNDWLDVRTTLLALLNHE